jgi:hypothetical protein
MIAYAHHSQRSILYLGPVCCWSRNSGGTSKTPWWKRFPVGSSLYNGEMYPAAAVLPGGGKSGGWPLDLGSALGSLQVFQTKVGHLVCVVIYLQGEVMHGDRQRALNIGENWVRNSLEGNSGESKNLQDKMSGEPNNARVGVAPSSSLATKHRPEYPRPYVAVDFFCPLALQAGNCSCPSGDAVRVSLPYLPGGDETTSFQRWATDSFFLVRYPID